MSASTSLITRARRTLAEIIFPEGEEARNLAEREANTDPLTQIANRRALDAALPAAEANSNVAVILFDLNNFGMVNKLRSHEFGDELLCLAARHIETAADVHRMRERVFRRGGDEFVVLVPEEVADVIVLAAQIMFGEIEVEGSGTEVLVSLSGSFGSTFAEADSRLQARKERRKKGCLR